MLCPLKKHLNADFMRMHDHRDAHLTCGRAKFSFTKLLRLRFCLLIPEVQKTLQIMLIIINRYLLAIICGTPCVNHFQISASSYIAVYQATKPIKYPPSVLTMHAGKGPFMVIDARHICCAASEAKNIQKGIQILKFITFYTLCFLHTMFFYML